MAAGRAASWPGPGLFNRLDPHPGLTPTLPAPRALQVTVAGNVPDLCQQRVHIVGTSGQTLVESAPSTCSFVVSSQRCCRHGFAPLPAALSP